MHRFGPRPADNEVTVMEAKINALIKAAGVNVEPFCPGLFAKAPANVNTGGLIPKVGSPAQLLPQQREKNVGSLLITWASVFLSFVTCSIKGWTLKKKPC